MNRARAALQTRRAQLIERAEFERQDLARDLQALRGPFAAADSVVNLVGWWKGKGRGPVAGVLARLPLPWPLEAVRWTVRGIQVWRSVRSALRR